MTELGRMLRAREISCPEMIQVIIEDIHRVNPYLNAFSLITYKRAMNEAQRLQTDFDRGIDHGPLHGIPYAVKGLFDIAGEINNAGTSLLTNTVALEDSAVVARLQQAGAVLVGQTQTSPLAANITGVNNEFGTPRNPWKDTVYIPGGSSSGSAVAVAAGLVPFAIGTDTGGSVRVPAALCGVVGLKPTVATVDTHGMHPLSSTLDSIGPISRTVNDAASVYSILRQQAYTLESDIQGINIGVCETVFFDEVQTDIQDAVRSAVKTLETVGANVCAVNWTEIDDLWQLAGETSVIASEAYPLYRDVIDHPKSDWVLHWLRFADVYCSQAISQFHNRRLQLIKALEKRLQNVDVILVPTTARVAIPLDECNTPESHSAVAPRFSRNTYLGNLAKWCGISVPCGFSHEGLPIGLMIYAAANQEAMVMRVAQAFARESGLTPDELSPPYIH